MSQNEDELTAAQGGESTPVPPAEPAPAPTPAPATKTVKATKVAKARKAAPKKAPAKVAPAPAKVAPAPAKAAPTPAKAAPAPAKAAPVIKTVVKAAPPELTSTPVLKTTQVVKKEGFASDAAKAEAPVGYSLDQKLLAEFVGTFALVIAASGGIVAATFAGAASGAGLVSIALAQGLVIAVMVSALGHVSGAHFNPAVTLGLAITRKMPLTEAVFYWVTQLAGGAAGALAVRVAVPTKLWEAAELGVTSLSPVLSDGQGILIEAILTFLLVWVIFGTAVDPKGSFGKIAGLGIGFTVALDIMIGGPFTGAAMNPARWFGPALVGSYWDDTLIYLAGPLLGGALAALLYSIVLLRDDRKD